MSNRPLRTHLDLLANQFSLQALVPVYKYSLSESVTTKDIKISLANYQPAFLNKNVLYSTTQHDNNIVEINGKSISIDYLGKMEESVEFLNFLGRKFKIAQKSLRMENIGKKYYNPKKKIEYSKYSIEIWPGFISAVNLINNQVFVNVDLSFKVVRKVSALAHFKEMMQGSSKEKVRDEMIGGTVMTNYNNKMYVIDDLDFSVKVDDTFPQNDKGNAGEPISYIDYYQKKWNLKIVDRNQFMLKTVDKKSKRVIYLLKVLYLVPELCFMTGMTDKMRADFNLNKDIAVTTKCGAGERMKNTQSLVHDINNPSNERAYACLNDWQIKLNSHPLALEGEQLDAGSMIFGEQAPGKRNQVKIEQTPDFDRKTQTKMYDQPQLKIWGIFCPTSEREICQEFINTIQQCVQTFNYPLQPPSNFLNQRSCLFRGKQISRLQTPAWNNQQTTGPKKNAYGYKEIKQFLIQEQGIPSQCVCAKTLQGKGIRSICNKILVQICAKIGGIPWTISQMPFENAPTMVFGMDLMTKVTGKHKRQILAMVGTMNKSFSKYWSSCKCISEGESLSQILPQSVLEALNTFKAQNNIFPQRLIFMIEGISQGQRGPIKDIEIPAIRTILQQNGIQCKIVFICVNKKVDEKFYIGKDAEKGLQNPQPGTLIQKGITDLNSEFFLVGQKTTQGIATPSNFFILENDYEQDQDPFFIKDVQDFCYKQCYMYYNWVGSVKVPAPIQYCNKLSNLVSDKFDSQFRPHQSLGQINSLYFI